MKIKTVGIAGLGAIGSAVGRALIKGIDGLEWTAASNLETVDEFNVPLVDFKTLAKSCDIIIECLPPSAVPELAKYVFAEQKTLILISSCALLMFPEILNAHKNTHSRILVPSGALAGIDGVKGLKELGIEKSIIASTKKPSGFSGAPYVDKMGINLEQIQAKGIKTKIFEGNALEAAKASRPTSMSPQHYRWPAQVRKIHKSKSGPTRTPKATLTKSMFTVSSAT